MKGHGDAKHMWTLIENMCQQEGFMRAFIASSAARAAFVLSGSRGAGTIRFGGSSSAPCASALQLNDLCQARS